MKYDLYLCDRFHIYKSIEPDVDGINIIYDSKPLSTLLPLPKKEATL
jgi:hypothetical protein